LVGQLRGDPGQVRSKAIIAARDLLLSPLSAAQCIAAGLVPALVSLLLADAGAPAPADRIEAARTLEILLTHGANARAAALAEPGLLPALLGLLAPSHHGRDAAAARQAALRVLQTGVEHESFRAALALHAGAVAALLLVARAGLPVAAAASASPSHSDGEEEAAARSNAIRALSVLIPCVQARGSKSGIEAASAIARNGGLQPLAELLAAHGGGHHHDSIIRLRACAASLLSEVLLARPDFATQAVEKGCVPAALELLEDGGGGGAGGIILADDVSSRPTDPAAAAAAALMVLTRPREGKVALCAAAGAACLITKSIRAAAAAAAAGAANAAAAMAAAVPLLEACANAAELPECRDALGAAGAPSAIQAAIDAAASRCGVDADDGSGALVQQSGANALKLLAFRHHPHV
jgi:hypothetical protein